MPELDLTILENAVRSGAAFRCRSRLQPAGGAGSKVFPPTYAGSVYAVELRRVPIESNQESETQFETRPCVVLDSVQSQANRMEEALQEAVDAGRISIPVLSVDFSPYFPGEGVREDLRLLDPIGRVTSLEAPHRIADAILRDSECEGEPFRSSDLGRCLDLASLRNATPLFQLCPTSLVFGVWDSTGPKGGLGAKFERALVSEIVGIGLPYRFDRSDEQLPKNHGVRNDPLGIRAAARVKKGSSTEWELADDPKAKGTMSPAEINHSNVPFDGENCGVTIDYAEQTTVLSLAALRRLKFPQKDTAWQPTKEQSAQDEAARTVLAALGICASELAAASGMDLRSRCLLWPEEARTWELLGKPGMEPEPFNTDANISTELLTEAVDKAEELGVNWHSSPIQLTPSERLVRLVVKSQQIAAAEGGEE